MNTTVLLVAVFLASAALSLLVVYFLLVLPAGNRAMRVRLEAILEASNSQATDLETTILRQEVLSRIPAIHRFMLRVRPLVKLNLFLQQSAMKLTLEVVLSISSLLGLIVALFGLVFGWPVSWVLIGAAMAGSSPFVVLAIKRQKRFAKFEAQFPEAIDLLARAVRAGHAFTTGLEIIGNELPEPIAGEFRRTYDQQNLGLPLREALQNLLVRVPLQDVHVFVTALVIQREAGGNLGEILDKLSQTIRERFKLMRQVKVFTAQGRLSLYVIMAMAPAMGLGLYLLNHEYMSRLFTDPLGQKALVVAVALQLFGYLIIRKIVQPKF